MSVATSRSITSQEHVGERLVEEADGVLDAGGFGEQTPQGRADGVEVVDVLAVGVDEEYFNINRLLGDLRVAPNQHARESIRRFHRDAGRGGSGGGAAWSSCAWP